MIFLNQRQCPVHSSQSSLVVNETKIVPDLLQETNLNEVFKMLSDPMDEILKAKSHFAGVVTLKTSMHHHAAMRKKFFLGQYASCDVVITLLGNWLQSLALCLGVWS